MFPIALSPQKKCRLPLNISLVIVNKSAMELLAFSRYIFSENSYISGLPTFTNEKFNENLIFCKLHIFFQSLLNMVFKVPTSGKYVIVLQYYHDSDVTKSLDVYIRSRISSQRGRARLHTCRYILRQKIWSIIFINL